MLKSLRPIYFLKIRLPDFLCNEFLIKMYKLLQNYLMVKDNNPFTRTSRLVRVAREPFNFKIDHFKLRVAAVIWLKYCRHGVKHNLINQSLMCVCILLMSIYFTIIDI